MSLDAKRLKENVASLSAENLLKLQKKFPEDWEKIRMWGFHTAGFKKNMTPSACSAASFVIFSPTADQKIGPW